MSTNPPFTAGNTKAEDVETNEHHHPLTRIPLIVRVISFAALNPIDPLTLATVNSSWGESVRDYSAVPLVWKNLIHLASQPTGYWLQKMKADAQTVESKERNDDESKDEKFSFFEMLQHFIKRGELELGNNKNDEAKKSEPFSLHRVWKPDRNTVHLLMRKQGFFKRAADFYFREEIARGALLKALVILGTNKGLLWYFKKALESGGFTLHGLRLALDFAIDADNAEMVELVMDRMIEKTQIGVSDVEEKEQEQELYRLLNSEDARASEDAPYILFAALHGLTSAQMDCVCSSSCFRMIPLMRSLITPDRRGVASFLIKKYAPKYIDVNFMSKTPSATMILNRPGLSPLRYAIETKNFEVVKLLFDEGVRCSLAINHVKLDFQPLYLATTNNAVTIVDFMLHHLPPPFCDDPLLNGKDPNIRLDCITHAAGRLFVEMLTVLLKDHRLVEAKLLNPQNKTLLDHTTPLHALTLNMYARTASDCTSPDAAKCCKLLVDAGFPIDITFRGSDVTPLAQAIQRGLENASQMFLDFGANPEWKSASDPQVDLAALARSNHHLHLFKTVLKDKATLGEKVKGFFVRK